MFVTKNGWTKERMKEQIRKRNTGKRAMGIHRNRNVCTYLTDDGKNSCAVGAFIPVGHEATLLMGGVVELLDTFPRLKSRLPLDQEGLIFMQDEHDLAWDGVDVREALCKWIDQNVQDA
jgi:hypothetical protein